MAKLTIDDFTPEIQARVPEYIERALEGVFDGGRYEAFDREKAVAAVNWNYEFCGYKKPVVIVAENPYEAQLLFNYVKGMPHMALLVYLAYCFQNNEIPKLSSQLYSQLRSQLDSQLESQLRSQLRSQLSSQLDSQLYSQLRSQLRSQLDSQLESQLRSQLSSQLSSQLDSQLYSQLYSQLRSQLDSQLDSQLESQLRSQLRSQLSSQLYSQLRSQLRSQLDSQLESQLRSQLSSQLSSQLDSQLYSQLRSQLRSQLDSQLRSQLRSQLSSQLSSQLDSQLYSQLRSQLRSQLDSQLRSQLESQLRSQLSSQLDSQLDSQLRSQLRSQLSSQLDTYNRSYLFTLNVFSDCYYAWYEFLRNEFNLPLSVNDQFQACFRGQKDSGIYSAVFSELLCVVSRYPKKVHRNNDNQLHRTNGEAVEWGYSSDLTQFPCLFINGRSLERKYFDRALNGMTLTDFNAINNEDVRAGIITIIKEEKGEQGLLDFLQAQLVDERELQHNDNYSEVLRLYRTSISFKEACDMHGNTNKPYAWINMTCPSTGQSYLISTCPSFENAEDSAKWHRPNSVPADLPYRWISAN